MGKRFSPKTWIGAFRGFYKPDADLGELDAVSRWLFASRSVILIISMQAAIIAGILAYGRGFSAVDFILVFIGFVVAHATSNLLNDYYGFVRGHDTKGSPRLRYTVHPLASGIGSKGELARRIAALVLVGLLITAYFVFVRGIIVLAFLFLGGIFLLAYDAFPVTLKRVGLGEIAAFIVWGPFMIGCGYYLINGHLSLLPFLAGIPYGLGVMSILVGKHIDQLKFDKSIGQNTLPVLLGGNNARVLNISIVALMYVFTAMLALSGIITLFALIVFLNLPNAFSLVKIYSKKRPGKAPPEYVGWPLWYHRYALRHNRTFGWLYILGLLLGALLALLH